MIMQSGEELEKIKQEKYLIAIGFPRIQGTGVKQLADKRAVYLYELGLSEEEKKEVLKEMAKAII